jgi:general secretion pathway protein G
MRRELSVKHQALSVKGMKKGFTLIELLVVISILGVLATLLISNVTGARERARDTQRKSDLLQMKEALRMYKNDFDSYPAGSGTIAGIDWGEEFKIDSTTYMKILPKDPSWSESETNPALYSYTSPVDGSADNFLLCANLENKSDQDIAKSQARCGGQVGLYCVCVD